MNLQLTGKTVVVTGGASGIGEATVRLFLAEGAHVVIVDKDGDRGAALKAELHGSVMAVAADLTSDLECRRAVEVAVAKFGGIDVLVNNAGVNDGVNLERPPADFMRSLQLNLFHVYAMAHHTRKYLCKSQGAIVNVSSKVSVTGQGGTSGYAAAKGGVNALTREWAVALAGDGIRVNCVVPAECDTPQYENWFQTLPDPAGTRAAIEALVPLGRRMTSKEEIAAMIVFLCSPMSAHTTGQIVFVDGGYTHLDRACSRDHARW